MKLPTREEIALGNCLTIPLSQPTATPKKTNKRVSTYTHSTMNLVNAEKKCVKDCIADLENDQSLVNMMELLELPKKINNGQTKKHSGNIW